MDYNKIPKIFIATPTTGVCQMAYTYSLTRMLMYYSQNQIFEGVESQTFDFRTVAGSGISANRERLVNDFLETDFTHILFIDEDTAFTPDVLHILANRRKGIVGANYMMRVKGKGFTALSVDCSKRIITTEESSGIEECYYTGFGMCLIERSVFEEIKKPWFLIGYNTETDIYSTEDSAFAKLVHDADISWYVDHDVSKNIVHHGDYPYTIKDYKDANVC